MGNFSFEIWKWLLVLAMTTHFHAERNVIRSTFIMGQGSSPLFRWGIAFTFGSALMGMVSGLHISEQLPRVGPVLGASLLMASGLHHLWKAFEHVELRSLTPDDLGFILIDESLASAAVGFGIGMTRLTPENDIVAHLVIAGSVLSFLIETGLRKSKQRSSSWFTYFCGLFMFTTGWFLI